MSVLCLALFCLLYASLQHCMAYSANVTGSPEIVYNWTSQHCPNGLNSYQWDVPDAPVRAFRQNSKNITWLFASVDLGSRANYALDENLSTASVKHSCDLYKNSTLNHNVSLFIDHEWITATYIMAPPNDDIVYGLIHMEYHGWSDATPKCTDPFPACWYNAITTVISRDGGLSWDYILPPPLHLTAAFPYTYFYNQPVFGWRSPSNILRNHKDQYFYATITTAGYKLQNGGTSIMRTNDLSVPNSWKCYNESSGRFDVSIGDNPYTSTNYVIAEHVCTIITNSTYPTLLWSSYYNRFMMVGTANGSDSSGYSFSLSDDLVNWGDWSVIRKGYPGNATYQEIYPSFIDPNCNSSNYDCVGKDGYLYYIVSRGEINSDTLNTSNHCVHDKPHNRITT
eukprot:219874_1